MSDTRMNLGRRSLEELRETAGRGVFHPPPPPRIISISILWIPTCTLAEATRAKATTKWNWSLVAREQ